MRGFEATRFSFFAVPSSDFPESTQHWISSEHLGNGIWSFELYFHELNIVSNTLHQCCSISNVWISASLEPQYLFHNNTVGLWAIRWGGLRRLVFRSSLFHHQTFQSQHSTESLRRTSWKWNMKLWAIFSWAQYSQQHSPSVLFHFQRMDFGEAPWAAVSLS